MEELNRSEGEGWSEFPVRKGFIALHRSGAAVEIFINKQKAKKKTYEHLHAGVHGEFFFIPKDDMALFDQVNQQKDIGLMVITSPAFVYFLSQLKSAIGLAPEVICEKVVRVSRTLRDEYDSWLQMMKGQIREETFHEN